MRARIEKRNNNSKGRKQSRFKLKIKKSLRCFICHKKGHFKCDCPNKKGKNYDSDTAENLEDVSFSTKEYDSSDVLDVSTTKYKNE